MANIIGAFAPETTEEAIPRLWSRIALGAILLLSVFLNFFQLGQRGFGNDYYAAAVRSMGNSWQNFFFGSFDPRGFVTIDKPPLGFWLQTLSSKIFGFSPFSLFLPQALGGVLAVLLLSCLVRRHFGDVAGLPAALALAVTPISVVTNRDNVIDGTLTLTLLLSAWALIHAAETGKLRWLLLSGGVVGLGFNIKMAQAYLVVPALIVTYLLCAPRSIWTRIWHLVLFAVVVLTLSASWPLAVDQIPATQRPYISSTQTNSALSLAVDYNGLNRFKLGPTGASNTPGLFRLFNPSLGGQIAWLLPLALLAIVALAWQRRLHLQTDRQHSRFAQIFGHKMDYIPHSARTLEIKTRFFCQSKCRLVLKPTKLGVFRRPILQNRPKNGRTVSQQLGLLLWGMGLLTMATFFTLDASLQPYYMSEMAPGLCALVGIGLAMMWQDYRRGGWRAWLLPLALLITAGTQISLLATYPGWWPWISPVIAVLATLAAIALIVLRARSPFKWSASGVRIAALAVHLGMLALLIAPLLWSSYTVMRVAPAPFPYAGPNPKESLASFLGSGGDDQSASTAGPDVAPNGLLQVYPTLISYLEANQGNAEFLVAVPDGRALGAPISLATNKPVMDMGGYSGSDPILTLSALQNLIRNKTVRFFLIYSPSIVQNPEQYAAAFPNQSWISHHCSIVPVKTWEPSTNDGLLDYYQLYDCASVHW